MKLNGKWIYLANHSIHNLDKMYEWSKDIELITIELGKVNNDSKDYFKNHSMKNFIENNHESNTSFCHFGIHRKYDNELIGYADFQDIENDLNNAELSLSIPDKKYRNKHYGIDAAFTALMYGLMIRNIKNITIRTRIDNDHVTNMYKKLTINYTIEHFSANGYETDLVIYKINKEAFLALSNRIIERGNST